MCTFFFVEIRRPNSSPPTGICSEGRVLTVHGRTEGPVEFLVSQELPSSLEMQGETGKGYTTPSLTIPSSLEMQGETGKMYTTPSLTIKGT